MPLACETRPASLADIAAITEIYRHYVLTHTATFEIEPPDEAEMRKRMQAITAAKLPYWVAESARAIAGYCYITPYRARAAYRRTVENSVYIAPAHVGKGIGKVLLNGVLDECAYAGYREVIAVIGDSANTPSINLHRRAGFQPVGTFRNVGYKFDRWLDTVLMQRSLPEVTGDQ